MLDYWTSIPESPTLDRRLLLPLRENMPNNFDFLRFLFASLVIFKHSYYLLGRGADEPLARLTRGQMDSGALAVDGFFVISGYLIAISWQRSSGPLDFLKKRALRIFPAYLAAAAVCLLALGPLTVRSASEFLSDQHWPKLALQALTLHKLEPAAFAAPGSFDPGTFNGSLWTIRIEFECYLLVMALGLAGIFRRRWLVLALLAACFALFVGPIPHFVRAIVPASLLIAHPRFVTYFLVGTTAALFPETLRRTAARVAVAIGALVVTARVGGFEAVAPVALSYLIFSFALAARPNLSRFAKRGDFSYGLYLYGWPAQQLVIATLGPAISPAILMVLAFLLALGLAALSWYLVERPLLAFKAPRPRTSTPGSDPLIS